MEEGDENGELPVEDAGRRKVEGVYVDGQRRKQVGEHCDGHAGTGKGGEADEPDDMGEDGVKQVDATWEIVSARHRGPFFFFPELLLGSRENVLDQ